WSLACHGEVLLSSNRAKLKGAGTRERNAITRDGQLFLMVREDGAERNLRLVTVVAAVGVDGRCVRMDLRGTHGAVRSRRRQSPVDARPKQPSRDSEEPSLATWTITDTCTPKAAIASAPTSRLPRRR